MEEQKVSIVEVAERAGVSIATASRVMSRSSYPVTAETREKVIKAATELNYKPNPLARGFRSQRSRLLAVIVGDNTDPYFAEVTRGVEEIATEHEYLTIICNTDRNPAKEENYLQHLQGYRVDGVIFAGGGLSGPEYPQKLEKIVKEMTRRGAAVVTLAQHTLDVPSIQADNFGGAKKMTARLIELGHRQIAFAGGPSNLMVANIRLQGYMAAMIEAGLQIDPRFILAGDFTRQGGERMVQTLLHYPKEIRPTAVFAANDETAMGLILGLGKADIRVPQNISVCGFGDQPMAQIFLPALTTVRIEMRQLGRAGAKKVFAMLQHQEVPPLEVFPTTIIERDTTASLSSQEINF